MHRKDKFGFWKNLKPVFFSTAAIKTVLIPVALVTAQLLSDVATQAISGNVSAVIKGSLIILAIIAASTTLQTVCDNAIRKRQSKSMNKCRIGFLEMLLKNPLNRLFKANHGELTENLNDDITVLTKRFTELYPTVISGALGSLGYMIFLICKSPIVAGTLFAISLLQLLPPLIVKKYMQVNYDECREMEAKITNHIVEAVSNFEVIKLYELKHWWQAKMAGYHKEYLSIGRKTDTVAAAQRSMYKMLDNILKFGTYALMGIYVMLGYCSIDIIVQAIYLSSGLFDSVKSIFTAIPEIAVSRNAEKRLDKWIWQDDTETETAISNLDCVALKNLCYSYEKTGVLNGISCQFDNEKNYLLEGSNGTGKTTLINLLTGLILPDSGEILIGKTNPHQFCDDAYPKTILYIPQNDPEYGYDVHTLFDMFDMQRRVLLYSIAKRLGLTDENINECAIRDLSGGERKKVFLSIGFAIQPKWLLLDEPSNNLDSHGKDVLYELIRERSGTIIISHDSSFHKVADCILKIEDGCIHNEK